MASFGRSSVRSVKKSGVRVEGSLEVVSRKIDEIERGCERERFDSVVVDDVGGLLTLGVCLRSGVTLDEERLGVYLLEDDKRLIEGDIAGRIRSKSAVLTQMADEVLGPFSKRPERARALAWWTTVQRRLESKKVKARERSWLVDESKRQDAVVMESMGTGFKAVLEEPWRRNALSLFSKIRRAGNKVPVLGRLIKL